jgi:hypothetical protein
MIKYIHISIPTYIILSLYTRFNGDFRWTEAGKFQLTLYEFICAIPSKISFVFSSYTLNKSLET